MKCLACGIDLPDGAAFCSGCGAKTGEVATSAPATGPYNSPARRDDPEVELWAGGYSGKAMVGPFAGAGLVAIVLVVVGILFPPALPFTLGGAVLVLLWVVGVWLYRRMNITYRLTSQRFFHQTGILTRTTNRIEVIEMNDVTYTQTFFERFFGVGTIKVTSSDPTDPVLVMPGIAEVQAVSETIDKARRKELTRRGVRIDSV